MRIRTVMASLATAAAVVALAALATAERQPDAGPAPGAATAGCCAGSDTVKAPVAQPGCCGASGAARTALPKEAAEGLQRERRALVEDTAEVRRQIRERNLALRTELNTAAPDPQKAADLQQQLSDLEARYNRRYIEYLLAVKRIMPGGSAGATGGISPCCAE